MNEPYMNLADLIRKDFSQMNEEERKAAIRLGLVIPNGSTNRTRSGSAKNIQTAFWIHEKVLNPASVTGYFYKRSCTCSVCGYQANMEKKRCPSCRALMFSAPKTDDSQTSQD